MRRRAWDNYFTPDSAVDELVKFVDVKTKTILEPCSGDGAIANRLMAHGAAIVTNDLNVSMPSMSHEDATDRAWWKREGRTGALVNVISNPPFALAPRLVQLAYEFAADYVAMLLRLSFLEPCEDRDAFLAEHPPTDLVILPRISFTGDGKTDNVTCAWFVWDKSIDRHSSITIVRKPHRQIAPTTPLLDCEVSA